MAETGADHVVNGNQSMGSAPAPVDAPQDTKPSTQAAGEAGNVAKEKDSSQETPSQDSNNATVTPQSADDSTSAQPGTSAAESTVCARGSPNGRATSLTKVFAQIVSRDKDNQEQNNDLSTVNSATSLPNGNPDITAFPEPSPMSTEGAELEWRRPSQGAIGRGERSNSIKKPTSFKSVSVTKNFLAKSSSGPAPVTKAGPEKGTSQFQLLV